MGKVNVKNFAPKVWDSYESYKAARRRYINATHPSWENTWVSTEDYAKAIKPWETYFGKWVAGKGICKFDSDGLAYPVAEPKKSVAEPKKSVAKKNAKSINLSKLTKSELVALLELTLKNN